MLATLKEYDYWVAKKTAPAPWVLSASPTQIEATLRASKKHAREILSRAGVNSYPLRKGKGLVFAHGKIAVVLTFRQYNFQPFEYLRLNVTQENIGGRQYPDSFYSNNTLSALRADVEAPVNNQPILRGDHDVCSSDSRLELTCLWDELGAAIDCVLTPWQEREQCSLQIWYDKRYKDDCLQHYLWSKKANSLHRHFLAPTAKVAPRNQIDSLNVRTVFIC